MVNVVVVGVVNVVVVVVLVVVVVPSSIVLGLSSRGVDGRLVVLPTLTSSLLSSSSLSFFSSPFSVIGSKSRASPTAAGKIISKKLFRQRSKSQGRSAGPQVVSPWSSETRGDAKVGRP